MYNTSPNKIYTSILYTKYLRQKQSCNPMGIAYNRNATTNIVKPNDTMVDNR